MNITIEIGGPIADAINRLADALISGKQADTIIEKASSKARTKKQAEVPAAPESVPTAEPAAESGSPETAVPAAEPTPASEPAPEPAAPAGPTRDDAKRALLQVVRDKGHPAGAAVLGKFGATKLGELKDEDIPAFIAATSE